MHACMHVCGMAGFLEHPQYPTWCRHLGPASVWALDAVKLLKGLQCFSVMSFDQCVCDAAGRKPTTLLLLRLPGVRNQLMQMGRMGRCPHPPNTHEALIGKQTDGSFQTAKAKVYPKGLNVVLGQAMFDFAYSLANGSEATELPEVFHPYTHQCIEEAHVVQPDYHGG